jgi:hypothetical protein
MPNTGPLTKALALAGTLLAWFPILATIALSVAGSIAAGALRCDYLMPAELFPVALVGGLLLLWAALRARSRRGPVGWGLGLMAALLVGGQALAVASGLAAGEIEPVGLPWVLVVASIVGYAVALSEVGIAGLLLLNDLFGRGKRARAVWPRA